MNIDHQKILADCILIAKNELGSAWNKLKPYADHEFQQFSENVEFLAKLKLSGQIDDVELKSRLEMQRLAFKNVLLTIEGIGLITAQNVVNAIIGIISIAIEKAIGVAIPI